MLRKTLTILSLIGLLLNVSCVSTCELFLSMTGCPEIDVSVGESEELWISISSCATEFDIQWVVEQGEAEIVVDADFPEHVEIIPTQAGELVVQVTVMTLDERPLRNTETCSMIVRTQ